VRGLAAEAVAASPFVGVEVNEKGSHLYQEW